MPSTTRDFPLYRDYFPCSRKLAAVIARIRVLAPEDPLRGLEGFLEGGRDFDQLISRYAFVKSKGPRIAPLEVERVWMISSKRAPHQFHLVAHESPGFSVISSVDEEG